MRDARDGQRHADPVSALPPCTVADSGAIFHLGRG